MTPPFPSDTATKAKKKPVAPRKGGRAFLNHRSIVQVFIYRTTVLRKEQIVRSVPGLAYPDLKGTSV